MLDSRAKSSTKDEIPSAQDNTWSFGGQLEITRTCSRRAALAYFGTNRSSCVCPRTAHIIGTSISVAGSSMNSRSGWTMIVAKRLWWLYPTIRHGSSLTWRASKILESQPPSKNVDECQQIPTESEQRSLERPLASPDLGVSASCKPTHLEKTRCCPSSLDFFP